jgi:hypothetical protein
VNTRAKNEPKRRPQLRVAEILFIGAGMLLILLGIYTMARPNLLLPAKRETLQIAGQKVMMETRRVMAIPRLLSGLVIVTGGGLILLGVSNRRM